jgi:His/Glu/Gln/Arg/opine family amino acid ABC transporter permease subunit
MLHGYGLSLLQGAALTLAVAFGALAIALALGLLGALAKLSRSVAARALAQTYTTVIRAVPDLVLMLLVFYGGQMAVNRVGESLGWDYIDIDPDRKSTRLNSSHNPASRMPSSA